mmetsp:Transcript_3375/g.3937  ORF Transcript_3375/g.3937 Transcript_3375/m.3937 type:complete len:88 (-) Transcript_3375:207-470(-)
MMSRESFEEKKKKRTFFSNNADVSDGTNSHTTNEASTSTKEAIDLIEERRVEIIFDAPFSPYLNPIENYFCVYKKNLKNNNREMIEN